MIMKEKIKIRISTEGDVEISVEGHKGKGCKDLTREIEKALGKTVSDKNTTEWFEKERNAGLKLGGM